MTPVTGVTNLNESAADWFWDYTYQGIEPAYDIARVDFIRDFRRANVDSEEYAGEPEALEAAAEEYANRQLENWESDCMILVGDWVQVDTDHNGYPVYDINEEGENGWAGIYRRDSGNILQVLWSKFAMMAHYCSPCYPGQGDLDTPGDAYLAYCLPPDEWDEKYKDENLHRIVDPKEWNSLDQ